jgi:ATP-dependent phosphofructokinase / diphosphate-dependent phosphofructokinase
MVILDSSGTPSENAKERAVAVKLVGNACIGQSGGPTVVINQSLVGVIEEARKHKEIKKLLGARHGTKGIMAENFIDLLKVPQKKLDVIAASPAAALGSVRHKPREDEFATMLKVFQKQNIRYYFYIGGDDSAKSADIIAGMAKAANYEMHVIHVPKTIDNNLMESDHSPGFGSAARFVACAVRGDEMDNRSLPGIKIDVIMGRDAGWLTAASMLARQKDGDGPHLVYLPEVPFTVEKFIKDVKEAHAKYGRAVICVSEGIRNPEGKLWGEVAGEALANGLKPEAQNLFGEPKVDAFGHFQLSGTGVLADYLSGRIKENTDISRVRADTFGYLQRSFPGFASKTDSKEAREVGRAAVKYITKGLDGSVAIKRTPGKTYKAYYELVDLKLVAGKNQEVSKEFICPSGNDICPSFRKYCLPLTGDLPETGSF